MLICGIPVFFLEVCVGQYLGVGGMQVVGQLAPIFKVNHSLSMSLFLTRRLLSKSHIKLFDILKALNV